MICIKKQYRSDIEALATADRMMRHKPNQFNILRAYKCMWCYKFHLTSQLPRLKKGATK